MAILESTKVSQHGFGSNITFPTGEWSQQSPYRMYLTAIVALGFVSILTVVVSRRLFSPLCDVPGPFWASVTRLWNVKIIIDGDQNVQLRDLHEKHGPFVRVAPNEVSVCHPDGVKKLFLETLPKGMYYSIAALPDWRFQTPMSSLDPKDKNERSKAFASGYAASNVVQYEDAVSRMVEKLLGWMDKHAVAGEPMDLDKFLTYTAFDVVGEVLFSKEFGFLDQGKDIGNSIRNNLALEEVGTWMGFFRWLQLLLGNPLVTWLGLSPGSMLLRTSMEALSKRRENPDARFDVVAHWFRYLSKHPDRTTLRNIEAQTTTNVGAGSDTVSCALQSIIYHMIRHPKTWMRARAEIEGAQEKDGQCRGQVVSIADAQRLPYLQACIKEGLRIHSPVPMGLPRVAPRGGVEIGGRHFPEGTTLSINPWALHHSKEIWGKDADEFRPERWLSEDAAVLERQWVPFGTGYQSCPGQHIARMELSKICSTIIRNYDVEQVDPSREWQWKAYFTMVPHSWPVIIKKRA